MHVLTPEGQILAGGRASLYVLHRIGWRRLATIFSWPPLVWLVEAGYWLVARNRSFFSWLVFGGESAHGRR